MLTVSYAGLGGWSSHGVVEILLNLSANSVSVLCCFLLFMYVHYYHWRQLLQTRQIHMLVATKPFSRQTFVATKIILSRQTRLLLRQKYACRNKHVFAFVETKIFCRDKSFLSVSILLSRQRTCFVATNTCLSQQTRVYRNNTFVATKMILTAAPVSDTVEDLHIAIVVFI